ncbi:MAG: GntR family transcriptional regulator [Clostridia bacterium]|nr:GntR family transcriptional regulator [Clostridia bacterium]
MNIKYIDEQTNKQNDAYSYISQKIESGEYPQGMMLIERRICAELNISRTQVRSALAQLDSEGELVDYYPNFGMAVRKVTEQDIREIYAIRIMIDSAAVTQFIRQNDPDTMNRLSQINEDIQSALSRGNTADVTTLIGIMYQFVLDNCNNSRLSKIMTNLLPRIRQLRHELLMHQSPMENQKDFCEFCKNYVFAIKKGKTKEAVSLLSEHYTHMMEKQLKLISR